MIDYLAVLVALICLAAIYSAHIPTGVLGSAGLALIGMAALVAVDDGSFANVERLEAIVIALLVGFLLLVTHITLMVYRSKTGNVTPRRRSTDWGRMDEATTIIQKR